MPAPTKISDQHKDFFLQVYEVVKLIPKGKVTSYGAIAAYLGTKSGARMVGWAMNSCPKQIPAIPAHRVVNRQGLLTGKGHFEDPNAMQERLEAEGLVILDDKVKKFKDHFWDPAKELSL